MIIPVISKLATITGRNASCIPNCWMKQALCSGSRIRTMSTSTDRISYNSTLDYKKSTKIWNVYLSGEIHTDWRQEVMNGIQKYDLPVELTYPILCHTDSDDCGANILGRVDDRPQWDMMGAKMNAIRTQTLIRQCDILIVKFGEQYRQWNAALDVGYATAHNKSIITIHPLTLSHMLKEVNACANVVCQSPEQAVQTLQYIIHGDLTTSHPPLDGEEYIPISDLGKRYPNP